MNRKAVIFGIQEHRLTINEKLLFRKGKPWGIILFSRNIKNAFQLKNLIDDIKKIFKDKKYPILIDQEGGKVSRLNKIIDIIFFSQNFFGQLYIKDKKLFFNHYKIYINKICDILRNVGVNINTVPVLDIRRKKSHNIIGSRSFSENSTVVSNLGKLCIDFYINNKIGTVIKHMPGLGLSKCDSHYKTPIIKASKKELIKKFSRSHNYKIIDEEHKLFLFPKLIKYFDFLGSFGQFILQIERKTYNQKWLLLIPHKK